MKKKICSIAIIAVMLIAVSAAFIACNPDPTSYELATKDYGKVSDAKTITKTVTETYADLVIASLEETYELQDGKYTVTTKEFRINGVGQPDTDTTSTKTEEKNNVKIGILFSEDDFSELDIQDKDGSKLIKATLTDAALQKIDLGAEDVEGKVKVQMTTGQNTFDELTLTYATANGYNIKITFVYSY